MGEQASNFLAGEYLWQAFGHLGHRNIESELPLSEDDGKKEADGADGLVHAGVGQFPFADQVQQVGLDRCCVEGLRGSPVVFRQATDAGQVGFLGSFGEAPQDHRIGHPLPECAHLVLLFWLGNIPKEKDRRA